MNRCLCIALFIAFVAPTVHAQDESAPFVRGGVGDKPFITRVGRTSVGGYTEAHFRFEREEGFTHEITFEPKRFNIFTFTPVSDRVRVASEIEFEEGGEEIVIELAILDFELHPALNFRSGMLLSPLGKFNLAHDSPANDLTDRPLVNTELIGTALSEPGMGFYSAFFPSASSRVTYELYGVNGFNDGVLVGDEAGTRVPAGKGTVEDNNNHPSVVGRLAVSPDPSVEVGFSAHFGPYNEYEEEGLALDEKRELGVFVVDGEARFGELELLAEYAEAHIDVPASLGGLFAENQRGYYAQANFHFARGAFSALPDSMFTAVGRYGWVDFNTDVEGDNARRLTLGVNFRPTEDTAFKLDYQHTRERDGFNNRADSAAILFSVASYF